MRKNRCGCRSGRLNPAAIGPVELRNCTDRPDSKGPEVVGDEGDDGRQRDGHCCEIDCCDTLDDRYKKKKEQMNFGCFFNISMVLFGGVLFKFILPAQKFEAAVS